MRRFILILTLASCSVVAFCVNVVAVQHNTGAEAYGPADTLDIGKVYDNVSVAPVFPHGGNAMQKFVHDNFQMPLEAWLDTTRRVYGSVVAEVIITKSGKALFVKTMGNEHPAVRHEVERVVNMMPLWTPASYRNEVVNCRLRQQLMIAGEQPFEIERTIRHIQAKLKSGNPLRQLDIDSVAGWAEQALRYTKINAVLDVQYARALSMLGDYRQAIPFMKECCNVASNRVAELIRFMGQGKKYGPTDTGNTFTDAYNVVAAGYESNPLNSEQNQKKADALLYTRIMTALLYAANGDNDAFVSTCDSVVADLALVSGNGLVAATTSDLASDTYYRRDRERALSDMLEGESDNAARRRVSVSKNIDVGSTIGNIDGAIRQGVVDDAGTVQANRHFHSLADVYKERYKVKMLKQYAKLIDALSALRDKPAGELRNEARLVLQLAYVGNAEDKSDVKKHSADFIKLQRKSLIYKELHNIEVRLCKTIMDDWYSR